MAKGQVTAGKQKNFKGGVLRCSCGDNDSPGAKYQNEKYGHGMRVVTPAGTCTVCGHKHSVN